MRITIRFRYPRSVLHLLLLLVLMFAGGYYRFQWQKPHAHNPQALMSMSASIPAFPLRAPAKTDPVVKSVPIEKNQTFSELMGTVGMDGDTIRQICEKTKDVYNLNQIHAGKTMVITTAVDNQFQKLEYAIDPTQTLMVKNQNGDVQAELVRYTPEIQVKQMGGVIEGSLYGTIDRLGEGDELVANFAEIFEWDVDFYNLQAGDTFRIVFERQFINGEPYNYGRILAAQLLTKGHEYNAIGFQHGENWEFFSPDGKAMKKAFLVSPLKFTRITSGFTSSRYHPILKTYRPHYGIDYAAPVGTPVRAIGSGVITLAGWGGGAGKTVKIQHNKEITTVYGHLSRYAGGIRKGAHVSQGQVIGYVGSTGLSTGPHLDFRFLKNGKYVNFLSIKSPQAEPLGASDLASFQQYCPPFLTRLQSVPIRRPQPEYASFIPSALRFTE